MPGPLLLVEGVSKTFEGRHPLETLRDVSLHVDSGEFVSLVGPSGCGKSTLFSLIAGVESVSAGRIAVSGETDPDRRRLSVGYMFQKDLLFPWRTTITNVMLGLELKGVARAEARQRAHGLLDQLGLQGFETHYPSTLSGGMRQRAALARTLVNEPEVLLLDEPFASLDFQTKLVIEGDTARLVRGQRRSALLITHDVEEAVSMSDRVIVLSHRPTRIRSVYEIELAGDRTDMMAARESPGFSDYVRSIWADLEVARA